MFYVLSIAAEKNILKLYLTRSIYIFNAICFTLFKFTIDEFCTFIYKCMIKINVNKRAIYEFRAV